jgi:hypothetical protein
VQKRQRLEKGGNGRRRKEKKDAHNPQPFRRVWRAVGAKVSDNLSGVKVGGERDDTGDADEAIREVVEERFCEFRTVGEAAEGRVIRSRG